MASLRFSICVFVALAVIGCDDGGGSGEAEGNLEYFCSETAVAWCSSWAECSPTQFVQAFGNSLATCLEQTEAGCLNPRDAFTTCEGATEEETDVCVDYINSNTPDGCNQLSADMSPCEDICECRGVCAFPW